MVDRPAPVAAPRPDADAGAPALQSFERYARLAAGAASTPIAALVLHGPEHEQARVTIGLSPDAAQAGFSPFCMQAMHDGRLLIVPDATQDPRFAHSPLVRGPTGIRFYAGVPIRSPGGGAIGTLCVMDTTPRSLSEAQVELLVRLSYQAESDLRARQQLDAVEREVATSLRVERSLWERAAISDAEWLLYRFRHAPRRVLVEVGADFAEHAGVGAAEIQGEAALLALVHPEDRPVVAATLELPSAASLPLLVRWRRSDGGHQWVEQHNQVERNARGEVLAFEARGTPRRPQAAHIEHLASSRAALVASIVEQERMREELLALVVHDFKAPLSSILAASYALSASASMAPADREILDEIEASARSLDRQVLGLLDLYTHEVNGLVAKPEPTDVMEIAREAVERIEVFARLHGQQVEVRGDGPLIACVDRDLLRRALENLLDNASRYARSRVLIEVDALADAVALVVRDDGPGVPVDDRHAIFDKFKQLNQQRRGRGLGLAFCKMAAEANGGSIYVTDNVPTGAAFHLRVPRAA